MHPHVHLISVDQSSKGEHILQHETTVDSTTHNASHTV